MFQNAIRLGRIRGIEVGPHYRWFIVFGMLSLRPPCPAAYPCHDPIRTIPPALRRRR
jgi:hypothetical protein